MGTLSYYCTLQLVNFLLEHELIPRRDIHRGLEVEDLVEVEHQMGAVNGLIFRECELKEWSRLSLSEQGDVIARAHRRKALFKQYNSEGA